MGNPDHGPGECFLAKSRASEKSTVGSRDRRCLSTPGGLSAGGTRCPANLIASAIKPAIVSGVSHGSSTVDGRVHQQPRSLLLDPIPVVSQVTGPVAVSQVATHTRFCSMYVCPHRHSQYNRLRRYDRSIRYFAYNRHDREIPYCCENRFNHFAWCNWHIPYHPGNRFIRHNRHCATKLFGQTIYAFREILVIPRQRLNMTVIPNSPFVKPSAVVKDLSNLLNMPIVAFVAREWVASIAPDVSGGTKTRCWRAGAVRPPVWSMIR